MSPDDGSRRGRPTKLTDALHRSFIELLLSGCYRQDACRNLGVSYATFRSWMNSGKTYPGTIYEAFLKGVLAAEARCKTNAVAQILAAGREDAKYFCWWLERKYPNEWGAYRGELGDLKRRIREMEKLLSDATETSDQAPE
jgi:hypothetical protein